MTTRILLVRHAETDWNVAGRIQGRTDTPLNETGRAQALAVARTIAASAEASRIVRVVSSPFARAADTARPIADALGLAEVDVDDDLGEQAFGIAEGMTWDDAHARWPDGIPGVETRPQVVERTTQALRRCVAPDATTVVVTHGGVVNAINFVLSPTPADSPGRAGNVSVHAVELTDQGLRRAAPADLAPEASEQVA
ncbi:histidine phosphatase family protein [Agromyces larvae]|uniref:Histidine phosphatase family protein n=1 Tax=Agromyces larvae TaxID=2929802 RepID=A0ABY4C6F3_9MICO|nr:histidine phosphatase family protein [Agromyces larvae]UOE45656.1 histidine phosphatase family protein [Agromyces larvae]